MKNETTKAIVRFIIGCVLLMNVILVAAGKNPIPFNEAAVTEWLSIAVSGAGTIWAWYWKNNNLTNAAKEAQNYKKALQEDGDGSDSLEEEV